MTGIEPKVASVANVIPASVITLVNPNNSGPSKRGAKISMFIAPMAKPIEISIDD